LHHGLREVLIPLLLALTLAGCNTPTPPLPTKPPAEATVRVAILTPMTGELGTFGETVRNGITLAFDEWNEGGGVNGQFFEWVLEDTRCDPLEARQAAERAINDLGARFIVGGLCSESAIPIARVANEAGVLFVATTATHPLVTVDSEGVTRPLAFRAAYAYPYQGRAAARLALDELNTRRAAVLTNPSDDFVRSLTAEFTAEYLAGGGEVVAESIYPPGGPASDSPDADFETIIADIAKAAPEVLYVPDAYPVANRVGSLVRNRGLNVTLIGSEVWDNGDLDLEALDGAFFTTHYSRETPIPVAEAWEERYLSAYAIEPDTLAALGYDAASLLASAIESEDSLSPHQVARRLETTEFEGITGGWRFGPQHDPLKPVVVVRIEDEDVVFHTTVRP
jgi:branched-chain amino acid transport system substrate-binding protein